MKTSDSSQSYSSPSDSAHRSRSPRPRRSLLFMPATNERAVAKARTLQVDTIILDLEDSVLADQENKQAAREALVAQVEKGGFGYREVLGRANAPDTPWFAADLARLVETAVDGIVLPKIESAQQVRDIEEAMRGGPVKPLWVMLETPLGILEAQAICSASPLIEGVLIGTADLGKAMKVPYGADRAGMLHALSHTVLAARACGLSVIDGVYMDIANAEGLETECAQGVTLGYDGKSLIHPAQLEVTNRVFSPDEQSISHARALVEAWESARDKDRGVFVYENKLVEHLHVQEAQALLGLAERIKRQQ